MGITANFRPAQHVYQSTYEPFPFEQIAPIAMRMQQEHMAGVGAVGELYSSIGNLTLAGADSDMGQRKMDEARSKVQEVLKKSPNARSPEFQMNLRKVESDIKSDPFWKNTAANAEMEKKYKSILNSSALQADKYAIEKQFADYQEKGTSEFGLLPEPQLPKRADYRNYLDKMGEGFEKETVGKEFGVRMDEVAAGYGVALKGNDFEVSYIPRGFIKTDEGQSLVRDAEFQADMTGRDFEEVLNELYKLEVVPLIYQHSGMKAIDPNAGRITINNGTDEMPTQSSSTPIEFGLTAKSLKAVKSLEEAEKLDNKDIEEIVGLTEELDKIGPNSPRGIFIQQQINDKQQDIDTRKSQIEKAKQKVKYTERNDNFIIDAFLGETTSESSRKYMLDNKEKNLSDVFEYVPDYNKDGNVTFEDLEYMVQAVEHVEDSKSALGNQNLDDKALGREEEHSELYNQGLEAMDILRDQGRSYLKDVKNAGSKIKKLDKEFDSAIKNTLQTNKYNSVPFKFLGTQAKDIKEGLEESYSPTKEQWVVLETNDSGEIIGEVKSKPDKLNFNQFSTSNVPGYGYQLFDVTGEDGEQYKVYNTSFGGDLESLGTELQNANNISKDQNPGVNKITAFVEGFRMIHPGVANSIDRTELGEKMPRTVYNPSDGSVLGHVTHLEKDGFEYWTVSYDSTGDGEIDKTLGADVDKNDGKYIGSRNKVLAIFDAIINDKKEIEDRANNKNLNKEKQK